MSLFRRSRDNNGVHTEDSKARLEMVAFPLVPGDARRYAPEESFNMLKSHMDAVEEQLLATSKIPANSGHSLHKGTPREAFISQYLESHLPSNVAIGTGEIIDANSKPGASRNQYDIVIYKRSFPKLDFGGGISGFLIESVIATIEVKSTLTQEEFGVAAKSAHNCKQLVPNTTSVMQVGHVPPKVLNFIVAYDGPAKMKTVHGWIATEYQKRGIPYTRLPQGGPRLNTPADAVDGVMILGRGLLYFDNFPMGFSTDEMRESNPAMNWIFSDTATGNLLFLFLAIQQATTNLEGKWLNPIPYLQSFQVPNVQLGA